MDYLVLEIDLVQDLLYRNHLCEGRELVYLFLHDSECEGAIFTDV